jgi:DNA-binding transcriptional LysR family regulator
MRDSHDLADIAIFTAVAELRSMTAAADHLGLSKATVSKHVTALEAHLGVRLLSRTTRSTRLTEAGARFHLRCQAILADLKAAEADVQRYHVRPEGQLRVTASSSLGALHIAPMLGGFLDRYPDIVLDLRLSDRKLDLSEGDLDLAIRVSIDPPQGSWLSELAPCRQIVCAAPGYLEKHGWPLSLDDLQHHSCLSYAHLSTGELWPLSGPEGACSIKVSGRIRCNSGETMLNAVLSGAGIALMPTFLVAEAVAGGTLENVFPALSSEVHRIYAVVPPGQHLTPKVEVFLSHLAALFEPPPYWDRMAGLAGTSANAWLEAAALNLPANGAGRHASLLGRNT